MSRLYKRHQLVWLDQTGWLQAIAQLPPAQRYIALRWQQRDWPLVVRRQDAGASADQVCLGLALPPDAAGQKQRLALRVACSQVRAERAPLELSDVLLHAAPAWRAALSELALQARAQALDLRVYGSLALQALTGLEYLRPGSDIDLLLIPGNRFQLERGMLLLARFAARLPLDGEVQFPAGAVAWKEWLQHAAEPGSRVLLKSMDAVALMRVDDIVAGRIPGAYEEAVCPA